MKILVRNGERVQRLSKEQFDVVHDFLVERINSGKHIQDAEIVQMCKDAGVPISFDSHNEIMIAESLRYAAKRTPVSKFMDLSTYVGDVPILLRAREYLASEEAVAFFKADDDQQRAFLLLVAETLEFPQENTEEA